MSINITLLNLNKTYTLRNKHSSFHTLHSVDLSLVLVFRKREHNSDNASDC